MKRKKRKSNILKLIIVLFSLGFLGIAILFFVNAYIRSSVKNRIIPASGASELEDVDCILVLGAGVWNGDTPSHMLEDRLNIGIELYQEGISNKLLMSGDHGRKEYDEVNVMKQYAIDKGIASIDIFMDHAGFSTYESMYRAKEIFQAKKIVVVTQEYHMYRALYIAGKLGLEAYGVSSDPRPYAGQDSRELREFVARVKDFAYCIFKPEPTYLGEAIPVSGNGDVTND